MRAQKGLNCDWRFRRLSDIPGWPRRDQRAKPRTIHRINTKHAVWIGELLWGNRFARYVEALPVLIARVPPAVRDAAQA
jgi:hypothetical protein